VLAGKRLELARSLYADQKNAPRDIAKTLSVSLSTLYRYAAPSPAAPNCAPNALVVHRLEQRAQHRHFESRVKRPQNFWPPQHRSALRETIIYP
jgi:hypothetical protein